jgi:hypothetical protein
MDDRNDDIARNRWLVINMLRLGGVAMVVIGLLMLQGRFGGNETVAYALIGVAMLDIFVVPQLLARKWRTPRQ